LPARWRLAAGLGAAWLAVVGPGCSRHEVADNDWPVVPVVKAEAPPGKPVPHEAAIQTVAHLEIADEKPEQLPPPAQLPAQAPAGESAAGKMLPICLDTVLALAGQQNLQVALARERLAQSETEEHVAELAWLPEIDVGAAYWRHEGGIQNEDGTLTHSSYGGLAGGLVIAGRLDLKEAALKRVNAERQVIEHQGEVSRQTSDTLLDAGQTYVDLLQARTGEAVTARTQQRAEKLLERANKLLAEKEPSAKLMAKALEAQVLGLRQVRAKLHQQGDAAGAKLAYLLNLHPGVCLEPLDPRLAPFELVDACQPVEDLVGRARAQGPGVAEMERLVALVEGAIAQAHSPARLLPTFAVGVGEGVFGAGPGHRLDFDNRLDAGVAAYWNLTKLLTAKDEMRVAESKLHQAHLSYQDLLAKLTAGVEESREASLSGREQVSLAGKQVAAAGEAYDLADKRLQDLAPGSSITEVLQALQTLETAEASYVAELAAYDKAQLQLLVLLGAWHGDGPPCGCPR
jgi:outer membrane protein TolC